ncbi:hypothetical protein [Halonatronum saccharophilum]|uniref:hypothetical protein n=1 Tax=Halonatronum saccharophilum TaxID=150060 RepID=UPI00048033F2|nr:hypothetical protein [Halonatronum saccharophilum]
MNKEELFTKVNQVYNSIDFNFFNRKGFNKDKDYVFIYSYPPVQSLNKLTKEQINKRYFSAKDINLYIHIPYCTGKCTYCYFSKIIDNSEATVSKDEYIKLLEKEILLIKEKIIFLK